MLRETFSLVCGQVLHRSWAPGGEALPFCQRCTGLFVGAFAALTLAGILRGRADSRRLLFDGLCLIQMIPLGLHWLPHGAAVRMISGWVFAQGLVDFLLLLPAARWGWGQREGASRRSWLQVGLAAFAMVCAWIAASQGGFVAARVLAWSGWVGLVGLALLVFANVLLLAGAGHLLPGRRNPRFRGI